MAEWDEAVLFIQRDSQLYIRQSTEEAQESDDDDNNDNNYNNNNNNNDIEVTQFRSSSDVWSNSHRFNVIKGRLKHQEHKNWVVLFVWQSSERKQNILSETELQNYS